MSARGDDAQDTVDLVLLDDPLRSLSGRETGAEREVGVEDGMLGRRPERRGQLLVVIGERALGGGVRFPASGPPPAADDGQGEAAGHPRRSAGPGKQVPSILIDQITYMGLDGLLVVGGVHAGATVE